MHWSCTPVIHHQDNKLCQCEEQLGQSWDALIPVIHSWEVDHTETPHHIIQVVHEGDSGTLYLQCSSKNLLWAMDKKSFLLP